MTFSVVAADPDAGEVGVAVQSKFPAAGAIIPWAAGDVGAVATQSFMEVTIGPRGLDLLRSGADPTTTLDHLLAGHRRRELLQVGIVAADGRPASFTGTECFPHAESLTGPGYACQGNMLASDRVLPAMVEAVTTTDAPLAERMVAALQAAQAEGGDARGQQAAALLVTKPDAGYGGNHDRFIDLRVDDHETPIAELARLLGLHRFHFQPPEPDDVIAVDAALRDELDVLLRAVPPASDHDDLWARLFAFMGWENLEERWVEPGGVDRHVLEHLRRRAQEQRR